MKLRRRAAHHLEPCDYDECTYCNKGQCCFAVRDAGCVMLDPGVLQRTDSTAGIIKLIYSAGIYDPRDVNNIMEGYEGHGD